jgi:hypothetical protein
MCNEVGDEVIEMGYFVYEFVVGIVNQCSLKSENKKALNRFVKEHKELFSKSREQVNGYITYVMFYDGSKEGWEESEKANELRERFIELLDRISHAQIYHVRNPEDSCPVLNFIDAGGSGGD